MVIARKPPPPQSINFTTIDFDDVAEPTVIDSHYSGKGVTFASITTNPPKRWHAYVRNSGGAVTQPNIVSVRKAQLTVFDAIDGGIQATFRRPQRFVAITARATVIDEIPSNPPTARPFIEFFNLKGAFIPVTQFYPFVYGHPNWGIKWQLSYVAPSAVIGSVIFSCEISSPHRVLAAFDHLVFSEDVPRFPQIPLGAGGL